MYTYGVLIADPITSMMFDLPHGAQVDKRVNFEVTTLTQDSSNPDAGHVHYLWTFGDEVFIVVPRLVLFVSHPLKEMTQNVISIESF